MMDEEFCLVELGLKRMGWGVMGLSPVVISPFWRTPSPQ